MNFLNKFLIKISFVLIYSLTFISIAICQKGSGFRYRAVSKSLISKYYSSNNKTSYPSGAYVLNQNSFSNNIEKNTNLLQNVLNTNKTVVLPNITLLVAKGGITLNSNNTLVFQSDSKLIIEKNNLPSYELIKIHNVSNVQIINANLEGDRNNHIGSKGEWGYGISIRNSSNVLINNFRIENFWGDGIAIGYGVTKSSRNIVIKNGYLDNNRRNGLSVMNVVGLTVNNVLVSNTNGINPMFGVDFEPNNIHDNLNSISLNNIYSFNNANGGLMLTFSKLKSKTKKNVSFTLNNFTDIGSPNGLMLAGVPKDAPGLEGNISISNVILDGNKNPITGRTVNNRKVKVDIDGLAVRNPVNKNVTHKEIKRVFDLKSNYSVKFSQ